MKAKVRLPQCPFPMFCLSAEYDFDFATTSVDMIKSTVFISVRAFVRGLEILIGSIAHA